MAFLFVAIFVITVGLTLVVKHKIGLYFHFDSKLTYLRVEVRFWGILVAKVRFYITDSGVFMEFFTKCKQIAPQKSDGKTDDKGEDKSKSVGKNKALIKAVLKTTEIEKVDFRAYVGLSDYFKTAIALGAIDSALCVVKTVFDVSVSKTVLAASNGECCVCCNLGIKLSVLNILKAVKE